jgi:hypothetical protein
MTATWITTWTRPRFAWLLWLALLLPLAQVAAAWHAQSHGLGESAGAFGAKHAPMGDLCKVCVTAASVTGGGAPSTAFVVAAGFVPSLVPPSPPRSLRPAPASPAYQSRAPPFAPR